MMIQGMGGASPGMFAVAGLAAVCVGVIAVVLKLVRRGRGSTVTLDLMRRLLSVSSHRRQHEVGFGEIRSWRVRRVPYASGVAVNGQRTRCLLLEVLTRDGRKLPVHAFSLLSAGGKDNTELLVQRTQRGFAELTGTKSRKSIVTPQDEEDGPPDRTAGPIAQAQYGFRVLSGLLRQDAYSDLM
jgi:hypothetical protein